MSNTLLTIADITNEGLMLLENELVLADKVNREYDDRFGVDGAKIGYTVNIRKPARFKGTAGPALNVEDFVESSVPVTLTNQFHVDTQFITSDLLLSMDQFSKRVLKPKIATIANRVDYDLATAMRIGTANIVGTPGTSPTTLNPFLLAGAILDTEGVPRDGERYMVADQFTQASMVQSLTGLFNPQAAISEQYKKGLMSRQTVGFDWYMDQNISNQTFGSWAGTPKFGTAGTSTALLTSGWADSGTLYMTGFTASTAVVNVGDTFTIAGVYMVNPQNRAATKQLRTFVVRPPVGTPSNGTFSPVTDVFGNVVGGTYTSDSSGNLQLTVAVAVISAGQFQNVSAAPANNAAVTATGTGVTGPQSLAFHKDAFALVSADLPLPGGVDMAARASHKDVGMSIRVVRQYTIGNDALPTRLDVLYGVAPLYRELACRVSG
jgi:P22 coat protein - gene protein 5